MRLRALNDYPTVAKAISDDRLRIIHPDHTVEAGFLCFDPAITMRTFEPRSGAGSPPPRNGASAQVSDRAYSTGSILRIAAAPLS